MIDKRHLVVALAFAAFAPLMASCGGGSAHAQRSADVAAEIATLKAQVAQLKSQADYQMRLITTPATGGVVAPGGGFCTDPCTLDSDGDGTNDCADFCPCDPANADGDGDGVPDCADPCPTDPTDACIDPCRQDTDGDGVNDCEDPCPFDPNPAADSDGDGIPDCADPCPADVSNDCIEPCPLDSDGDGVNDCGDPCPYGETGVRPCIPPAPPSGARPAARVMSRAASRR